MLAEKERVKNAISNLKTIKCYKPYIDAYKKGIITMYEGFGGYYVEDGELLDKIHEIEKTYTGTIYGVIHSPTNFGDLYTLLWSTGYPEDVQYDVEDNKNGTYNVMTYVWNKSDDACSEFGTVTIKPALGGLIRVY